MTVPETANEVESRVWVDRNGYSPGRVPVFHLRTAIGVPSFGLPKLSKTRMLAVHDAAVAAAVTWAQSEFNFEPDEDGNYYTLGVESKFNHSFEEVRD